VQLLLERRLVAMWRTHFRQVISVFADALFVLDELVAQELLEMSADALQARDAVNHVPRKMKSIQVVQDSHIEWSGRCSCLFVSTNVEVVMIRAPIS
jgi:hypothetical protein